MAAGSIAGLKQRTRLTMGRSQGFYCAAALAQITSGRLAQPDVIVIGAGPAGLSAATDLGRRGLSVIVLDRKDQAGSIPRHCDHPPYGLREFHRLMRGPAYARRLLGFRPRERFRRYPACFAACKLPRTMRPRSLRPPVPETAFVSLQRRMLTASTRPCFSTAYNGPGRALTVSGLSVVKSDEDWVTGHLIEAVQQSISWVVLDTSLVR